MHCNGGDLMRVWRIMRRMGLRTIEDANKEEEEEEQEVKGLHLVLARRGCSEEDSSWLSLSLPFFRRSFLERFYFQIFSS